MEEAPGVVFVEMRDAKGGGACRGVRKARLCDGILLLVDTTIEGASPSHARQE